VLVWGWLLAVAWTDARPFLENQSRIQRFQALCRLSSNDAAIRVLIYGQSITAPPWVAGMVHAAAARFPSRSFLVENRSIGGCTAPYLLRLAEADVYPFNPDLIIFHAFGDTNAYQSLLSNLRSRTTADLLLLSNPYSDWDRARFPEIGAWDGDQLPKIAATQSACMADVRTVWRNTLLREGLDIRDLLVDVVHPNERGEHILAEVLFKHLAGPAFEPLPDPFNHPRVHTVHRPPETRNSSGWRVPFHGNRVVAQVPPGAHTRIFIDGKPPSQTLKGRLHGRTSPWPKTQWPFLLAVGNESPLLEETWTLRIQSIPEHRKVLFTLRGSSTGYDGQGSSNSRFRSQSGRVVIEPSDWFWDFLWGMPAVGTEFTWQSIPTGRDDVHGTSDHDTWIDLVSNLEPGPHELVLSTDPEFPPITSVRIHDPTPEPSFPEPVVRMLTQDDTTLFVSDLPLEESSDLQTWTPLPPSQTQPTLRRPAEDPASHRFLRVRQ